MKFADIPNGLAAISKAMTLVHEHDNCATATALMRFQLLDGHSGSFSLASLRRAFTPMTPPALLVTTRMQVGLRTLLRDVPQNIIYEIQSGPRARCVRRAQWQHHDSW